MVSEEILFFSKCSGCSLHTGDKIFDDYTQFLDPEVVVRAREMVSS